MTLKEMLDHVWNRPGVIHPCHINRFSWERAQLPYKLYPDDYFKRDQDIVGPVKMVIICRKGRKSPILGPKPKGKGFSFLSKFYYHAWISSKNLSDETMSKL